mgnify:FL=1|jgi:hypothetical protein
MLVKALYRDQEITHFDKVKRRSERLLKPRWREQVYD